MSVSKLKTLLADKSQKELISEIAELYKKLNSVKDFYDVQLNDLEGEVVLQKYKNVIQNEFFPTRGYGDARLSVAKKSVMDFKKLFGLTEGLVELAIFYVEIGVKYTVSYGDINEAFYNSMERMYLKALEWMKELNILDHFKDRAEAICMHTNGIGWGFHDYLCQTFDDFFDDEALRK